MLSSRVWFAIITEALGQSASICGAYRRADSSSPGIITTGRDSLTAVSVTCAHEHRIALLFSVAGVLLCAAAQAEAPTPTPVSAAAPGPSMRARRRASRHWH